MKKRLLSAALALAMVLTMIPATIAPAFADPVKPSAGSIGDSGVTTVTYYDKIQPNLLDNSGSAIGPGWYYAFQKDMGDNRTETRYAAAPANGVVAGTSTSGVWYSEADLQAGTAPNTLKQVNFTLLGDVTITGQLAQSLTVDTNGFTLSIGGADMTKVTSLTVEDKQFVKDPANNTQGDVDWDITHADDGDKHANTQTFTLTLRNGGQLTGGVNLANYASHSISMSNYAKITGAVTMSCNPNTNASTQNVSLSGVSEIGGTTTLTGNSTRVEVTSSTLLDLNLNGTGTQLAVSGITSSVGAVNLSSAQDKTTGATNASVTVNQGTVDSITQKTGEPLTTPITLKVGENGTVTNVTTIRNSANITVDRGSMDNIILPSGSLTVNGPNADIGELTLNTKSDTTFKVAGSGNDITSVTASNGGSLTVDIAAEPTNTFGATRLTGYDGHGIKGGTFAELTPVAGSLANKGNDALVYQWTEDGDASTTFYTAAQLADGLFKQATNANSTLTIVGQTAPTLPAVYNTITFKRGTDTAGVLSYTGVTSIAQLPNKALGTAVASWTDGNGKPYGAGDPYDAPQPAANVVLTTQGASQVVTKINGVNAASTGTATGQDNQDITATLNGNVITLSGAVYPTGGVASFQLKLMTDLLDPSTQMPVPITVWVNHNTSTNRTYFGNQILSGGLSINSDGSKLTLFDGNTSYTLNGSGLKVVAGGLNTDAGPGEIKAVYTGTGDKTTKDYIASLIEGTNDRAAAGEFTWSGSTAIKQAINTVQAGISESQIKSWREQAQRASWQKRYSGSPTKEQLTNDAEAQTYQDVYMVPYLYVSASGYNQNATLNATLSVYYRIEVRSTGRYDPIEVQAGRALGNLGEELTTGATVKFGSDLTIATAAGAWMHQDGTYAYGEDAGVYTINHMGKTGLGTIVINKTAPLVTLVRGEAPVNTGRVPADTTAYYDTLQAAVDDTLPQAAAKRDQITVLNGYKASDSIDVTGLARIFTIKTEGNTEVTRASNNFTLTPDEKGNQWTVQLLKDTAPKGGNITIASATGGTASVSANPATVGQTVTITLAPQTGYTSSGVTVRNSSGQAVSVSGSGNTYTFVMPSGSVTVTPSFTRTQATNVLVTVSNTSTGSAVTNVGNNQVPAGTQVSVTTAPKSGYRTMGVSVTGANATRTGANTFTFYVPGNSTNVVVTPRFDVDNGTLFEDVWSYDYFSNPVQWAVKNGITNGAGSNYTFGTGRTCTREDMVTFLWRAAGSPVVSGVRNPFWDVQAGSYYYNAVMWAVSKGITQGVSSSQFGVGQTVTRGQAVTFLWRAAGSPNASTGSGFNDVSSREYYARAVSWAKSKGVTDGTSPTQFSPNSACLREQIVTFLYRDRTGLKA